MGLNTHRAPVPPWSGRPDLPLPHAGEARARLDPGQAERVVAVMKAVQKKAVNLEATQLRTFQSRKELLKS